jgi:hypothetical protein
LFIAFEASATQKFLQFWEQVKITWGPSLDYMLDSQKLPSQTLEALLAFWQQRAGAHCRAEASRRLTVGPAVGFEWRTVTASEL